MLSSGVDLVEVNRIEDVIARYGDRFLERVFTQSELAYCRGRPHQLAARFAAKEAVSKVLGTGIQHRDGVAWQEIQIASDEQGKPVVQLSGRAARRAEQIGLTTFALSLSHTREHAIALVVAQ
ncbi:MAG: holo-ACP synthase [Chloroflexota bacterium]|nr:holo-ACP synthase [Chloroflexota bacterium]